MKHWLLVILSLCLFVETANAQISSAKNEQQKPAKKEQQKPSAKNEQRALDEQMASRFFQEQDYEKARDLYDKLYRDYRQINHFNQYVECLIRLGDFNLAERKLKSFNKDFPNQLKGTTDLIYVYGLNGKKDKAQRLLNDIIKDLPSNDNIILSICNLLRSRGLNEEALAVFEKGAKISPDKNQFYMERAFIYQQMVNYQEAFKYYFLELEADPDQYRNIKNRLQTMLFYDVNKSIANELRVALMKKTQETPNNIQFAELLVWLALQEEDYAMALDQCKSIDRREDNQESQIINLSNICLDNKQFDVAHKGFEYVNKKGKGNPFYGAALVGLINTEYQKYQAENLSDRKAYEALSRRISEAYEEVSSKEVPGLIGIQAEITAYQLNQPEEAERQLLQGIENTTDKTAKASLKLKLADIYLHEDEIWEATLLYSQVDKSMKEEPIGHEARFKNAQLRYFIGEFAWAESQLKVLKAATSKLIANDAMTLSLVIKDNLETDTTGMELCRLARADYRIYQHRDAEALVLLDSIIASGNETSIPHALFRKAELIEKTKHFAEAKDLYLQIVNQFPYSYMADAALMQVALIEQNHLNDKTLAAEHYEKLIDQYPTSIYTAQAKKNYRKLQSR
ncbi:MAG: tetratricopeptide repeat protein [Bacteroidales bacterium]|nr:tetratricopeptide repeat protein [Bacteroidales bacterium]